MNRSKFILKVCSLILFLCIPFCMVKGAPVSEENAIREAISFLMKESGGKFRAPANLSAAYIAKSSDTALFYVFNYDNGFVITTADDRLPAILGYSNQGEFNYEKIPLNMRNWLKGYEDEISAYLPVAPESDAAFRNRKSVSRKPIEPLLKTKWDQDAPYNNDCPKINGVTSVTGCVATAVAQLMKFHEWPEKPTGSANGVTFKGTTYDWKNMLNEYEKGHYSSTQASAVAKLMRQVGAAVDMQYSPYSSGAYDYNVQLALPKYFGYSEGLTFYWKDYTPMKDWCDIVYNELSEGRPLYYSGASSEGGHAFVCDGYSENEYFHFNWGWGGYEDGYFLLSALNPSAGGAGSYEGGYNRSQSIITGIMPAKEAPAGTKKQVAILSTGSLVYDAFENAFVISQGTAGYDMIYNPLGYTESFDIGFKILNRSDNSLVDYVFLENITLNSFYGFSGFDWEVKDIDDGSYKLYLVFRADKNSEWKLVPIPLGAQNYIAMDVAGGEATFKNLGPDSDYLPELIISTPELPSVIYENAPISLSLPVINVGEGDFMAEVGISLADADDEFGRILSYDDNFNIPGKSFKNFEITIPEGAPAGKYKLTISDSNAKVYLSDYMVNLSPAKFSIPESGDLEFSNISPNFYTSGSSAATYITVKNSSALGKSFTLRLELLDLSTLKRVKLLGLSVAGTIPGKTEQRFSSAPANLDILPGEYLIRAIDAEGNPLTPPSPLIVTSALKKSDAGLYYIVKNEATRNAMLVAPVEGAYTSNIVVPETVDNYNIKSLRMDAFAFFEGKEVVIDDNIRTLPRGLFYCADKLSSLTINSKNQVRIFANTFNTEKISNCWLYLPQNLISGYMQDWKWRRFLQPRWILNFDQKINCSNNENIYSLAERIYPGLDNPFKLNLSTPENKNISFRISVNGILYEEGVVGPEGYSIDIPALSKESYGVITTNLTDEPVSVNTIADDLKSAPSDLYSSQGIILRKNASEDDLRDLPEGIYILGGKKIIK